MNSRTLLRRPTGSQAGTLTLPCYEQQITAEKTNRSQAGILRCHVMNSRALLRRPRGPQAGTLTLPCHEQQNTAEKINRHKLALSRSHVMNSRSLLRRPTGPQAGILRCHVMKSRALLRRPTGLQAGTLTLPKVSRKGIAPLPKGSLDPPHRNVWIAFSPTCKPERELHRFRKEASILRTETFGSPFRQLANPKGNCPASERKLADTCKTASGPRAESQP